MFRLFKRAEEQPIKSDNLLELLLKTESIDWNTAMQIPAFSACVNIISGTIAMIPFKLYERTETGIIEHSTDERVKMLNVDTGDTLSAVEFKKAMVKDYFTGGAYAYIAKSGNNFKGIYYVENGCVSVTANTDPIFKSFNIMVNGKTYRPYQFLRVLRDTTNGYNSKSIVSEHTDILLTAYKTILFQKKLASTGGIKRGFIQSEKQLSEPSMKALKEAWSQMFEEGTENMIVLNNGLKFQDSSATSTELQLNENKQTDADAICAIFNVSPGILSGKATKDERNAFIQYCITPILAEFENSLNKYMLLESEKDRYFWSADTTELTKADIKARFEAYQIGIKNGFMQIDEIRQKEKYEPLGLDFVKLGLQDVLYYPESGDIYTPNTGIKGNINDEPTQEDENNGIEN